MSYTLNNSSDVCFPTLQWSSTVRNDQQNALYVCIIAVITHSLFWLQLFFFPILRQKSLQWVYAYLATDALLLFRFFFVFIIRRYSSECSHNQIWAVVVCYIDATLDNYLNILQVYIFLALNCCRFVQIAYNRNVYEKNVRLLILTHITVYFFPLVILILQYSLAWARLVQAYGDSCDVRFTNDATQIINLITAFVLPIFLNMAVLSASIYRIHHTARLRAQRHYGSAREKYYRSLVIQFTVFYAIWLALWSPNILVYQLPSTPPYLTLNVRLLNYVEIALDPFIIGALDKRFWLTWKTIWSKLSKKDCLKCKWRRRQIRPLTTHQEMRVMTI